MFNHSTDPVCRIYTMEKAARPELQVQTVTVSDLAETRYQQ